MTDRNEPPEALRKREANATSLEQCGWCEFAVGSHRYNYCIYGNCSLLKDCEKEREVKWDTPCKLKGRSQSELEALCDYHRYMAESKRRSALKYDNQATVLFELASFAVFRPPLPNDRKAEHFNIGDPVAVYHCEHGKWYFGEVKNGYRHHDGCVSYRLDGVGPQDGDWWGAGVGIPTVLLKTEYEWFRNNPAEYTAWCKKAYDKIFNGKPLLPAPISGYDY